MLDQQRKKYLSYAHKIIAHLSMDDHTYTHLSIRSSKDDQYYITPFGLCFSQIEEDDLIKANFAGEIIEGKEFQYNKTGYIIHSNIYKSRLDVQAIFHLHTPATVAVSAMKQGLIPISQWALHFYKRICYHEYNSLALDNSTHGKDLVADLGQYNVMLMRNHGMLVCGKTIMEAMFYAYHLEMACKTQCLALSTNQELLIPEEKICKQSVKDLLSFEKNLGERDWHAWVSQINSHF